MTQKGRVSLLFNPLFAHHPEIVEDLMSSPVGGVRVESPKLVTYPCSVVGKVFDVIRLACGTGHVR